MTVVDDEGHIISEKDVIKTGLRLVGMDVSNDPDSDFKRGMQTLQKLLRGK
jgi:hypothetical protein